VSLSFGLAGTLGGVQVWDWSDPATRERAYKINPTLRCIELAYNEMYVALSQQALLVGELSHWLYRLHQNELNHECHRRAADHIARTAERILGEPWELAE
jgi:hypothetical protein